MIYFFLLQVFSPINSINRQSIDQIQLTQIGAFGEFRIERPNIPAHYHTAIDILRPGNTSNAQFIFPIADGEIISIRNDGPFAHIIIAHEIKGVGRFWTIYEHISEIRVSVGQIVSHDDVIARFMNKTELDHYGWQFNHLHFEVLKVEPKSMRSSQTHPQRNYNSYSLDCFTKTELNLRYYDPVQFFTIFWD
jgi:murein DD-endopeptidase MepM/ murein hydrolase activator NlpD